MNVFAGDGCINAIDVAASINIIIKANFLLNFITQ
jgi:hypothetical protein